MANNPVRVNPLGQISDAVLEQVKDAGADTAKAVISEPAKILEQILGGVPTSDIEQGNQTSAQQQVDPNVLQKKQQESQEKASEAYNLHRQRLQEEIQYYEKRKQEENQEALAKENQEEEKKQVVQLKKEHEDDALWQQQIKAIQGSHEGQQGKM